MAYDPATAQPGGPDSGLQPRLIKGTRADYETAPDYPGHNPSGLIPLGPNVLIRIDTCSVRTAGADGMGSGVFITDELRERMDMATESGCVYAIGKTAWKGYADDERPHVGDRVYFQRYSGLTGVGADGGQYRIMDDSAIACRLDLTVDGTASRVGME